MYKTGDLVQITIMVLLTQVWSLESYETQPVTMVKSGDWWIQKYIIFSFSPTAVLSHWVSHPVYIPLINQFLDFFKRKYQLLNSEWKSIEKYQTNELLPLC